MSSLIITPDNTDFLAYMAETEPKVKVLPAESWTEKLVEQTKNPERLTGAKLPWGKTHELLRFRPGEVTLWQGMNGHGKSQILGQACLGFVGQEQKICIASFEMKPVSTLKRMLRQVAQNSTPGEGIARRMMQWLTAQLWIYDQLGRANPKTLAAVIRYCSDKLKIDHFVIDSLMRCVSGEDDYNGQKEFVELLCSLAQDHNIHIHLVHHARKRENEDQAPGKFDAKGSGAIVDQVDQMLTVWRNKKKERLVERELKSGVQVLPEDLVKQPDSLLICDKNRHGEWEGRISLWYHADSLSYTSDKRRIPLHMMNLFKDQKIAA